MFERVCFVFHDRQRVFGHGRLSKLQKIKENATPIEESSGEIIENQRKRYPYRDIVRSDYRRLKKTLPLSRNRRVYFRVCLTKVQNPSPCEAFCD